MKKLIITACVAAGLVGTSACAMNIRTTADMTSAQIVELARKSQAERQLTRSNAAPVSLLQAHAEVDLQETVKNDPMDIDTKSEATTVDLSMPHTHAGLATVTAPGTPFVSVLIPAKRESKESKTPKS